MGLSSELLDEHTDLTPADRAHLEAIVADWSLLADLGFSDLIMWVPTWNGSGMVALAQARPSTSPTSQPHDVVGTYLPRGRMADLDRALAIGEVVEAIGAEGAALDAYPVLHGDRVIAVIERHMTAVSRRMGELEHAYLATARILLGMVSHGLFPQPWAVDEAIGRPRVGDGSLRIDAQGIVTFASPNAQSAFRRLGLATSVVGESLHTLISRLSLRPMSRGTELLTRGATFGRADVEASNAVMLMHAIPLYRDRELAPEHHHQGALILVQDVTDLRRRERAVLSADATIREVHHRVKNNLTMVSSLLRMQARRSQNAETVSALEHAQARISAIASLHDLLAHDASDSVDLDQAVPPIVDMVRTIARGSVPGDQASLTTVTEAGRVPSGLGTTLALCLVELVSNALEHANAHTVTVTVRRVDREIVLEVRDDGVGMGEAAPGLGLSIVQSLVESVSGARADWETGDGTVARARFPIRSERTA